MTYNRNAYLFHRNLVRETLSPEQLQRQADAVAAYHARQARKRRNERLCALAVTCIVIAVSVALFYSATN